MKNLLDPPVRSVRPFKGPLEDRFRPDTTQLVWALTLVGLLILCFVVLAVQVERGNTQAIDQSVFMAFHESDGTPAGPRWAEEMGRDATALGGNTILILFTIAVFGFLAVHRRWQDAVIIAVSVVTGVIFSLFLKELFDRPRPELVPHLSHTVTSSFPSGHSMLAAVTYLTIGIMAAEMADNRRQAFYPLVVALILSVIVGLSRLHVGVHWPSDVLAGWIIGAAWALFSWSLIRAFQRSRALRGQNVNTVGE